MEKIYIFHLGTALIYLTFGMIVLIRNRSNRLHQTFGLIMAFFMVFSISLFISENPKANDQLARFSAHIYFILLPAMPFLMLWFALLFSRKSKHLFSKIVLGATILISVVFVWFANNSAYYEISPFGFYYISEVAYFAQWKQMTLHLVQMIYFFITGLVSIILIIRFGLVNIDYRVRTNAKFFAIAYFFIFLAFFQEQLQFILLREKQFFMFGDFFLFTGSLLLFYPLVKKGVKIFSSSFLAENILENLSYPVSLIDERGRIVYHNDKMKELTTMSSKKLNGMNIFNLLPTLDFSLDDILGYAQHGIHHIRTDLIDAFNNNMKVLISCQSIYSFAGSFQGIVFSFESLDKKPIAQAFKKDYEDRMLKAVEASRTGFWDWDIQKGDLLFSEETYNITGYSVEEMPDLNFTTWRGLIHPDDTDKYFDILNENLKGKRNTFSVEYRIKNKSGEWVWLFDQGRVIDFDANNNPARMSGMFTDITHLKAAQIKLQDYKQKLESSIKIRDNLIDFLATDIREPFNAIIGLTEILSLRPDLEEKEKEVILKRILEQSHRSFQLIENLLDFSRFEKDLPSLQKQKFNLKFLLYEIQSEFKDAFRSKQIYWEIATEDRSIHTDREILKRVIRVLLQDIIKNSKNNIKIFSKLSGQKKYININLTIQGANISEKWLDRFLKLNKPQEPYYKPGDNEKMNDLDIIVIDRLINSLKGELKSWKTKQGSYSFNIQLPA